MPSKEILTIQLSLKLDLNGEYTAVLGKPDIPFGPKYKVLPRDELIRLADTHEALWYDFKEDALMGRFNLVDKYGKILKGKIPVSGNIENFSMGFE